MRPEYYIGRSFTRMRKSGNGFKIELEGGAVITLDDSVPKPSKESLEGSALLSVEENFGLNETKMKFGRVVKDGSGFKPNYTCEIVCDSGSYAIADDVYTGGEKVYPGRPSTLSVLLPPDPSPDRVAEGPDTPQEDAENDSQAQAGPE